MVWPTDDLTTTHLDAGTDDPGQARAEIKACVDKLKTVLGEVSSGATVWHSGNDGGGSGLDSDLLDAQHGSYYRNASNINAGKINNAYVNTGAGNGLDSDLLDGQHGSYYQNASNLTSGTLSMSRIGTDAITADKIASGAVGQSEIATGAVHQGELKTVTQDMDHTASVNGSTSSLTTLMTATQYHLGYNYYSPDTSSPSAFVQCYVQSERPQTNFGTNACYGVVAVRDTGSYSNLTVESEWRYVEASGPFDIGDGDIPQFIYVLMKDGVPSGVSACEIPPWAYNGPTDITPSRTSKAGGILRKYKNIKRVNDSGDIESIEVEIDMERKNRDMNLIPHPFLIDDPLNSEVLILDPVETMKLLEYRENGVKTSELIFKGYLKLDNSPINRAFPEGVTPCRFKWKNTQRKAGAMVLDKRLKQGPYAGGGANANNPTD